MRRTVNLCGAKYNLDGSPTSLVARIFNGNNTTGGIAYNPSGNYSNAQHFWNCMRFSNRTIVYLLIVIYL